MGKIEKRFAVRATVQAKITAAGAEARRANKRVDDCPIKLEDAKDARALRLAKLARGWWLDGYNAQRKADERKGRYAYEKR